MRNHHSSSWPAVTKSTNRSPWRGRACWGALSALLLACGGEGPPAELGVAEGALQHVPSAPTGGALVDVKLVSRVGVVIDEIPRGERAKVAELYLRKPTSFWIERAKRQLRHTNYRLIYRAFFYEEGTGRQMLALPPEDVWQIELSGKPERLTTSDGHEAIEVGYTFRSTIVTDAESPGAAEPRLRKVGGVWKEPFSLPLDPEFLFQRTGYACMDEDGYPAGTAESENAAQLFDHECDVETAETASCHITELPTESCLEALSRHVGRVDTDLRLERVAYDRARANAARVGTFTRSDAPDLAVVAKNLDNHWVEYRYIPADSCALAEQCVGAAGWRRLLLFDASIANRGALPLSVGSTDEDSPPRQHNMFEFSACHEHFHFRHYGEFTYGAVPGDKRAFCVESTDRYYNNEQTPIVHEFGCENQGVAPGWGDTYIAGVECNWIDVTDVSIPPAGITRDLRFGLNPDRFLCEGQPVLDASGQPVYESTSFVTETGAAVDRPVCEFAPGVEANNVGARPVELLPQGGLVTSACTRGQAGPLRDCGFRAQEENARCTPGRMTHLRCTTQDGRPAQALRVCDSSAKLGAIPCMYRDALASAVVDDDTTAVSFRCPSPRDVDEPGGAYALYAAPLNPTDPTARVTCRSR